MRRCSALLVVLFLALPAGAAAATPQNALYSQLSTRFAGAGSHAGAFVIDATDHRVLFQRRADVARIPASNEKLFTTATALLRLGPDERIPTEVLGDGRLLADGTYRGNLYIKGFGDPTFGSTSFTRQAYGTGPTISQLAQALVDDTGITRVRGAILGDETYFDSRRGTPAENYAASFEVEGKLTALAFNRGLAREDGGAFQADPPRFVAARLRTELARLHVSVSGDSGARRAPDDADELALVQSPPLSTLARLTNQPSDNFLAETLLKGLGARFGGRGSTTAGARVVAATMSPLGVHAHFVDGSGLSRRDRVSPRTVVRLLDRMRSGSPARAFMDSLSVAGRSGTLAPRMHGTLAQGRCRGKTGTLSNASALSGYCRVGNGHIVVFSLLMNQVDVGGTRSIQNGMLVSMARYSSRQPSVDDDSTGGSTGGSTAG